MELALAIVTGGALIFLAVVRRRRALELAKRLEEVDDPVVAATLVDSAIRDCRRDQSIARKLRGWR